MPYYKFAANIVLTWIQNKILQSNYSEFHSGYRFYRMNIIKNIPYKLNSDYFDFDNQIIFQIHHNKYGIYETEIPTFYGDEISYVSPIRTPLAILINIFGGIVRCDRVANGVVEAYKKIGNIEVPIIVRLQGTNAEEGAKIIKESGLKVSSAIVLKDAAERVKEALA